MNPTTVTCSNTCTVALTIEPAPANADHLADYDTLYSTFLLAAMGIFLVKRLTALFTNDHER
jgi:hypothetical protein